MIMNPTQMHAAERLANQAIKTGTIPSIEDAMEAIQQSLKENTINPSKISEAQLAANRANAKHSTGPQSSDAKKRVSLNAVKSALTGRTVLLEGEDATAYQTLLNDHLKEFTPEGMRETALVQSLTDILWRLDRIPRLEDALIISSRAVMAAANPGIFDDVPAIIQEVRIRQANEKQFRNYALQENRLTNRRVRELKELADLQKERKAKELEELNHAAEAAIVANHQKQTFSLSANGFAFSPAKLQAHLATINTPTREKMLKEALIRLANRPETLAVAA
jgi:hypothetical protein